MDLNGSKNIFIQICTIIRFRHFIEDLKPDAIQCFLYPAELLSLFLGRKFRIFWSLRGSGSPKVRNFLKIFLIKLNTFLSKYFPRKIVACSSAAYDWAISRGVPSHKIQVINNFLPEWTLSTFSKSKLLDEDRNLDAGIRIGMAARLDVNKGHTNVYLGALNFFRKTHIPVTLSFIGRDTDKIDLSVYNDKNNFSDSDEFKIELIGNVRGTRQLSVWFANIDLYILASYREGFPNSLAEAVSIGCPSISTPSGNAKEMISETMLMANNDAETISRSISHIIEMSSSNLKKYIEDSRGKIHRLTNEWTICDLYMRVWTE